MLSISPPAEAKAAEAAASASSASLPSTHVYLPQVSCLLSVWWLSGLMFSHMFLF